MRKLALLWIVLLLVSACTGTPTPTATQPPPLPTVVALDTAAPNIGGARPFALPTGIDLTQSLDLPGTASFVSVAETDGAPTPAPADFDVIYYDQQGGISNSTLSITLYNDGRFVRDGVEARVSADAITQINQLLTDMRYLEILGEFQVTGISVELFRYNITVTMRNGNSRTFSTEDGATPPPFLTLYDALRSLRAS